MKMSAEKIKFMGLLANADSSILNVKLDHGFEINYMHENESYDFISILEGIPPGLAVQKIFMDFPFLDLSERKIYFISNCFGEDFEGNEYGGKFQSFSRSLKYDSLLNNYLKPEIRKMRLFKEGNICIPLWYYYITENDIPKILRHGSTGLYISPKPVYSLENTEIPNLLRFIQETKLPFIEPFLQLAFENFELSYQTHDINLSFLSLTLSLETLFNPGGSELTYRISRNIAVLLGKDENNSETIFSEIKELYAKRSRIVHTGKSNVVTDEDLLKLRNYVRESIKIIDKLGKTKEELLNLLHSSGFGHMQEEIET